MTIRDLIKTKDQAAENIMEDITYIIQTYEKRSPGTRGEEQACEHYAEAMKKCGCDRVEVEPYELHPNSFYGWIYITVSLVLAGIVLYFFAPVITVLFCLIGLFLALTQFGLYWEVVDKLFPKKTGHNMLALKKPTGTVERRILFNGHADAAWEWPVNYKLGGVGFESHAIIGFAGLFYYMIFACISCFKCGAFGVPDESWLIKVGLWGLLFVPFLIGLFWLWNEKRVVDGANDNLTGCEMGVELMKQLAENGIDLEHTEIGVLVTGSEEAGLRGAKAFVEQHQGEFDDVPTFIYSFDTIHDPKQLMVNYRDLNGTVKADKDVSDLFMEAAENIGIFCKKGWVPPLGGATDSAAFAQGGFRATGVTGLSHVLEDYYHTRRDTYDNMNKQGIADCYAVTVETLALFDEGAKQ